MRRNEPTPIASITSLRCGTRSLRDVQVGCRSECGPRSPCPRATRERVERIVAKDGRDKSGEISVARDCGFNAGRLETDVASVSFLLPILINHSSGMQIPVISAISIVSSKVSLTLTPILD